MCQVSDMFVHKQSSRIQSEHRESSKPLKNVKQRPTDLLTIPAVGSRILNSVPSTCSLINVLNTLHQ